MEPARLRSLPHPDRAPAAIRVDGDQLVIEHVVVTDPSLASFISQRPAEDHPSLIDRALRIGLTALQDAGVTVNVDVVRREFDALLQQTTAANERAALELDTVLRANFADGDGRLPRTLERFLGDRGALHGFVTDLFDETKRDSAIGRMRHLLGSYFDGDASRLAQLLDPTRLGSPLHQFRTEVSEGFTKLHDRLTAIEAAASTRAAERARSSAKGADFEALLAEMIGQSVRTSGDLIDRTAEETGDLIRSRKGDFVITVDPQLTRGADLRIVVEAKDRTISGRAMRDELAEAKRNRAAAVGLVVFTPAHAPAGIAPFDIRMDDVYCVIDPAAPDLAVLEAAIRLARLLALSSLREAQTEVDAPAVQTALSAIRGQLDAVRALKMQLTSIGTAAKEISGGLDRLREGLLARVAEAETELHGRDGRPGRSTAAQTAA